MLEDFEIMLSDGVYIHWDTGVKVDYIILMPSWLFDSDRFSPLKDYVSTVSGRAKTVLWYNETVDSDAVSHMDENPLKWLKDLLRSHDIIWENSTTS